MTEKDESFLPGEPPTWAEYWQGIGNECLLVGHDLAQLSPAVVRWISSELSWCEERYYLAGQDLDDWAAEPAGLRYEPEIDWGRLSERLDAGTYLSSTEAILAELVVGLVTGRPVDLRKLGRLGSWQRDVWHILSYL